MIPILELIYKDLEEKIEYQIFAKKILEKCFEVEKINPTFFYICVILTIPKNIKKINKQFRGINEETDILSFPIFQKKELDKMIKGNLLEQWLGNEKNEYLQEALGDIIISIPRVYEQAKEYGHSFEREFAYMLIHGFYHLIGYDHIVEKEKKIMRKKEENVFRQLDIIK